MKTQLTTSAMLLLATTMLTACVSPVSRDQESSGVNRPVPADSAPADETAAPKSNLSSSLRDQAVTLIDQGEFAQANRLLERALRADSRDAANYYQFARLRLEQQQPHKARQLAERGLSLQPSPALRSKLLDIRRQTTGG